jgi:aspartyl-tRNA(Asn)/glutamyl-tRNA(Gln) amidotransferase subunit C
MSSLSKEEISHIAELAKLRITEEESEQLGNRLGAILTLVGQMQGVNTDNIEPMSHAIFQNQKLRNDETIPQGIQPEILQKLSTSVENGFYLVPKVVD